jgi:DNA-binding LytR/AlgR family response regulator
MNEITVLIVDDEPLMCEELQNLLDSYTEIKTLAVCHTGEDALAKAVEMNPDAVFLDIEMPGITGITVADVLSKQANPPRVIFLTAHDEYALQAFTVDAFHYLLKPFDEDDIRKVISKLVKNTLPLKIYDGARPVAANSGHKAEYVRKFCVQHEAKLEVIDLDQIEVFYAKERQVFIQTVEGITFPIKFTLNTLTGKLDPKVFVRCHRNFLVNINQIKCLETWFNRGYMMILKGAAKTKIPVSRQYVSHLKDYLEF